MPTLDWIGKKAVRNHHKEAPFHLLKCDPDLSVGEPESGNLLVQSDNLLTLKALGELWTMRSGVACLFVMPIDKDYEAIQRVIALDFGGAK
jgi:adenine-specific DNA-methyltransferase